MKKIFAFIELEDKGQDLLYIDLLENGVISGSNILFRAGIFTLIGVGTLDGERYFTFGEIKRAKPQISLSENMFVYLKETGEPNIDPWDAKTINYRILNIFSYPHATSCIHPKHSVQCR